MLIGIDASRAVRKNRTGTENYSRNLIFEIAKTDRTNNYILYVGPDYDGSFGRLPKNFKTKIIPNKRYWTQIGLSAEMLKSKPDVLFIPAHILPIFTPKNTVVTIHDLAWKYFPKAFSKPEIHLQDIGIKKAIKKHSKLIVYSKSTYNDLKKFYKVDSKLVRFVPMGFSPNHSESEMSDILKEMVSDKYILFVGRLELKKNLSNLVKAYGMLRSERNIKEKLVLVGKRGFGYDEIRAEINNSKFKNDIIETGFVDQNYLSALYRHASVFTFPSLYEGFGFPILEAYAEGTPVITSDNSSMSEVAGKGALLVNPQKPFEMAAAMSQILNKPSIAAKLVSEGEKELLKFNWSSCARGTIKVLEEK